MLINNPTIKAITAITTLILAGCSTPPPPKPAEAKSDLTLPAEPAKVVQHIPIERFHIDFDDDIALDYQVEKTISRLNGKSCFAFITGTIKNDSDQVLSKRSVVDFIVINQDQILFRDITYPLAAIPPGKVAKLSLVSSPIHREGCPSYDKIKVALRKVVVK